MQIKSIKFNDDEIEKINEIVGDEKFSTFVKVHIFKLKKGNEKLNAARAKAKAYNEIAAEIRRLGNNLNQIAKHCNQSKSVDYLVLKQLAEIKAGLEALKW